MRQKVVSAIVQDKKEAGDPHKDLKEWRHIMKTVGWLGQEGMSSDESDVEGLEEVYHIKTLPWRRPEVVRYMDILDRERKLPNQAIFSRKGRKPSKRVRSAKVLLSDRNAVNGLPVDLYDREWYDGLTTRERRALKPATEPYKWLNIFQSEANAGTHQV